MQSKGQRKLKSVGAGVRQEGQRKGFRRKRKKRAKRSVGAMGKQAGFPSDKCNSKALNK